VRHACGSHSTLGFKSYTEGRESFQGTELDVIWLDEEPPMDIYGECLIRTMTTNGLILLTFTPLRGLSEVVLTYMPEGMISACPPEKFAIQVTWDDAPHLTEQSKAELAKTIPAYQLEARRSGVPQLGSGAIYTVAEEEFVTEPFEIPKHWPRCFGLDVGWNNTACVWLALDRGTDTAYIYDAYKRGGVEPAAHEADIARRGEWIPGVVDPAAIWRSVRGKPLGLANNDVEYGIDQVYRRIAGGRLKLFRSASTQWLGEYRTYRRDEKGKVVKEMDHLMDATRYAVVSGLQAAKTQPEPPKERRVLMERGGASLGWMS
jgi:phage terminase large subunit-like protein